MAYKQREYITVHAFDTPQADFEKESIDGNGLAILLPTVCTITEELNGTYEMYMEHPLDPEGRWKLLEVDNIIKAGGQLFRIKSRKTKMNSNGEKVRSVNCLHIWYDLAGKACPSYTAYNFSAWFFVKNLHLILNDPSDDNWYNFNDASGWYRPYDFFKGFSTDCGTDEPGMVVAYAHIEPANMVNAVIGSESSFVNVFSKEVDGETITPELYRDNFKWSLNWRRQGAVDNAFSIVHKVDMTDIEEVYDTSNYYTHVNAISNIPGAATIEDFVRGWGSKEHVPMQPKVKIVKFQYNAEETADYEQAVNRFRLDYRRYFRSVTKPRLTLKCNYAELSDTDLYRDYIAAKHCNVGDSGTVYCEDLGINQVLKVIRKKIDLINKDNVEITFGSKLASITSPEYMSQTINNSKFVNANYFSLVNNQE